MDRQAVLRSFGKLAALVALASLLLLSAGAVCVWRVAGPDSWNPADVLTPAELYDFYELPELARREARARHLDRAEAYAHDALRLAERYPNNWNYGNAIHDGHVALGMAALERGEPGEAVAHLRRAGATPGSPQLDTFGPTMLLADALARHGETEAVLAYLEACRRFWEMDRGRLDAWTAQLREGETPDFGHHLAY